MIDKDLFLQIRHELPERIAEDIVSVDGFPAGLRELVDGVIERSVYDEEQLIDEGFKPVSDHRIMWIK